MTERGCSCLTCSHARSQASMHYFWDVHACCECVNERERDRQTETETETDRQTETEQQRDRERERERERGRQIERQGGRWG